MENASKALIIAGAILISILLISLGILIYNQATNITNGQQMSEVEVSSYNSKFTQYEGDKVTGTQVRALINQVNTSNSSEDNINVSRSVEIVASGFTATGKAITNGNGANTYTVSGLSNTKKYKVEITGYNDNGCISQITISNA